MKTINISEKYRDMKNLKKMQLKKIRQKSNAIKNPERKSKQVGLILAKNQNDKNKI